MNVNLPLRWVQVAKPALLPAHLKDNTDMIQRGTTWTDLAQFNMEQLEALRKLALVEYKARVSGSASLYQKILTQQKLAKNLAGIKEADAAETFDPVSVNVVSLTAIPAALKVLVGKTSPRRWLMAEDFGQGVPYYVHECDYYPPTRHEDAHVNILLVTQTYTNGKLGTSSLRVYLAQHDLYRAARRCQVSTKITETSVDVEDEDGEEDEGTRTRPAKKLTLAAAGVPLIEILANHNLTTETQETYEVYQKSAEVWGKLVLKRGQEFLGNVGAPATLFSKDDWGYRRSKTVSLDRDGVRSRLVLDDGKAERDNEALSSYSTWRDSYRWSSIDSESLIHNEYWGTKEMPELPATPVVRFFDLDRHCHVRTHVLNVEPKKYDPEMRDKLVLPEDDLTFIDLLMGSTGVQLEDIVAGKTGGVIVICSGPPGTGKTLTGEVNANHLQRPLYSVQCSQLGSDEASLEKKLQLVLKRAERWNAVLLLDEADVYVRRRANSLRQNAIVGVFLRVLEYYSGVLFLTTNLANDIDDAVLSRATAHIRYRFPDGDLLYRTWEVLAQQFGVNLDEVALRELCATFGPLPGRSIKMMLKLTKFLARARRAKPDATMVQQVSKYVDLTGVEALKAQREEKDDRADGDLASLLRQVLASRVEPQEVGR